MTDETTWLTPAAHTKLQAEYEELTTTGRLHIEERIAEARSHGDLRENADRAQRHLRPRVGNRDRA